MIEEKNKKISLVHSVTDVESNIYRSDEKMKYIMNKKKFDDFRDKPLIWYVPTLQ